MDLEDDIFLQFVTAAGENRLEYLLIGGLALALHGIPRFTRDADIWIKPTEENKSNFIKTLISLGYEETDLIKIEKLDFTQAQIFRLQGPIDVLTIVHFRMDYDECRMRAKEFKTINGCEIHFIHINDLREFKILARRPKDLQDIVKIDELLEELERKNKE